MDYAPCGCLLIDGQKDKTAMCACGRQWIRSFDMAIVEYEMSFSDYQAAAKKTAIYPVIGQSFVYPALGLGDEAGEVQGKIKKIFRDKGGEVSENDRQALKKELGDVLWYLAQLATELGLSLDEIARLNVMKLLSRQARGVIGGDGDDR